MNLKPHYHLYYLLLLLLARPSAAEVRLPKLYGDHMVLQRDQPVKIWGWADEGEEVRVFMDEKVYNAGKAKKGKWEVLLDPKPAGGPYEIVIKGRNEVKISDVLFGDVWVCSGQSNMQWKVKQTGYEEKDSALIAHAPIRLLTVQIDMDYMPREDIKAGQWRQLSAENVQDFSAVSYHFGKFLQKELGVPIGLISSNLGATAVEAWMPNESLLEFAQFRPEMEEIVKKGKSFSELEADFEQFRTQWEQDHYLRGPGIEGQWYRPETDISEWQEFQAPGFWKNQELVGHDGAVWCKKKFDLPEGFDQDTFWLQLGQIDDYDITWVNGVRVGETYGRHTHRNYLFPSDILQPKDNEITVRVFDLGEDGGFSTGAFWAPTMARGQWKYRKGRVLDPQSFPQVAMPNATPFSSPAVLFNANIAPLTSLTIKGTIWYQGESNAARAHEYRGLFASMISSWRERWNQGDFPFFFVQLANYNPEAKVPAPSPWAELREAQTLALTLPNTGMAVTIDIGEAQDIHPKNKEDVGKRLGVSALKVAYGKDVVPTGPLFKNIAYHNDYAIIRFDHTGKGLMSKDKFGYLRGFEVAGADQQFHWAKAEIENNTVKVYCPNVKEIKAVRYAWANNPGPLDLYNSEGLPASPFRTDDWDGITKGKKYDAKASRF